MVFNATMVTFWMTLLMNKFTNIVWMMDEFIHWPKAYLLSLDEILSWMIEIEMKNHLVSDSICNTINV